MTDTSHYVAIQERTQREEERLKSETTPFAIAFRSRQVEAAKKELEQEAQFLLNRGINVYHDVSDVTDAELEDFLEGLYCQK